MNLRIYAGEAVGLLLGRNRMGKTTLIRGMLRLLRAHDCVFRPKLNGVSEGT